MKKKEERNTSLRRLRVFKRKHFNSRQWQITVSSHDV